MKNLKKSLMIISIITINLLIIFKIVEYLSIVKFYTHYISEYSDTSIIKMYKFGMYQCIINVIIYSLLLLFINTLLLFIYRKTNKNKLCFEICISSFIFVMFYSLLNIIKSIFSLISKYIEGVKSMSSISPIFFIIIYSVIFLISTISLVMIILKKHHRTLPVNAE